jgi:hypothetical protein
MAVPRRGTTQTITVRVIGDVIEEFDQYFRVVLTTPINATISDGKGLGKITDNDAPATGTILNDDSHGKLQFSSEAFSAPEDFGGVVVTVNRVDGATDAVTVDFATSSGTGHCLSGLSTNYRHANFESRRDVQVVLYQLRQGKQRSEF